MNLKLALVMTVALGIPQTSLAQDGPEDLAAQGGSTPSRVAIEIGGMTVPSVVLDFDAMGAGSTSVAAIQAAFPGTALADLVFTTRAGTGGYNFQTGGGRALVASSTGSGALELVDPPAGTFGNADALDVSFSVAALEMGFEIGDWGGPFNVQVFSGATQTGFVQVSTAGDNRVHFIQSDTPFDRVVLTAIPDNPQANWVVPSLILPVAAAPLPTAGPLGLGLLAVLLAATALWTLRRREGARAPAG